MPQNVSILASGESKFKTSECNMKALRKTDHQATVGFYFRGLSNRDLLISVNIKGCV